VKKLRFFSLLLSSSLLTGCGYRWQPDFPDCTRPTLTVPFVRGDEDGTLTAEIIYSLSSSGLVNVCSKGGEYDLQVSVLGDTNEKIGFRVDPQKVDGEVRKNLLCSEERRVMTLEILLLKGTEVAYGPYQLSMGVDYDYVDGDSIQDLTFINPAGTVVTVLPFSLGQLESVESANQAATKPLYRRLAQKIVDVISAEEWR
jgi:hypothetical protein